MATAFTDPEVIKPSVITDNTFFFLSSQLTTYRTTITAGNRLRDELGEGIDNLPILQTGRLGRLASLNIYFSSLANDTSAEPWELHMLPVWYSSSSPLTSFADPDYVCYENIDNNTRLITRTQPANTKLTYTLMNMKIGIGAGTITTATITDGLGSETSIGETQKFALMAPCLAFDINGAATSNITIEEFAVWGTVTGE
jgi:hypothetical protein